MMWWGGGSPVVKALPFMEHRVGHDWATFTHLHGAWAFGLWTSELFHISSLVWGGTGWLEGPGVGGSPSPGHWGSEFSPSWWTGLVHVPWGLALFHRSPRPRSRQKSIFLHIYCGSLPGLPEVSLTALWSSYDCDSLEFSAFTAVCPEAPASCQFSLRCSCPGSGIHSRFGWWVPSQGSQSSLCMPVSAVLGTSLRPGSSCLLWSQREFSLVKMEGWLPRSLHVKSGGLWRKHLKHLYNLTLLM